MSPGVRPRKNKPHQLHFLSANKLPGDSSLFASGDLGLLSLQPCGDVNHCSSATSRPGANAHFIYIYHPLIVSRDLQPVGAERIRTFAWRLAHQHTFSKRATSPRKETGLTPDLIRQKRMVKTEHNCGLLQLRPCIGLP
eukprot:3933658-Amphidinium_carterae.1